MIDGHFIAIFLFIFNDEKILLEFFMNSNNRKPFSKESIIRPISILVNFGPYLIKIICPSITVLQISKNESSSCPVIGLYVNVRSIQERTR